MLNAAQAEIAFQGVIGIDSEYSFVEADIAIEEILEQFHDYLIATYGQNIPANVEPRLWHLSWKVRDEMSYTEVEVAYMNEAAA